MTKRVLSLALLAFVAIASAALGYRAALVRERHGVAMALAAPSATVTHAPVPAALPDFASIVEGANSAVVGVTSIDAESSGIMARARRMFGERSPRFHRNSTGSGFIISDDGYVFTNHHVVEDASSIVVDMADGTELHGRVVGIDPETDLALLKVESPTPLPVLPLGDSDVTRVGEWVCAIGNPLIYDHTVTVGVVSAKGRRLTPNAPFESFLQTDAAINFGNSGGPLLNTRGEVVGINSAISSQGQNIGFAVPVNTAKSILPQLMAAGRVARGFLGVSIDAVSPVARERLELESTLGALITDVEAGGAASRAGVQPGDVVVDIDGELVESPASLIRLVAGNPPSTAIKLGIMRDGQRRVLVAKLAERKSEVAANPATFEAPLIGIEVAEISEHLRRRFELAPEVNGLVVIGVNPEGPTAASLTAGDVITQLNRVDVSSVKQFRQMLDKVAVGDSVLFYVTHHGRRRWVAVQAGVLP